MMMKTKASRENTALRAGVLRFFVVYAIVQTTILSCAKTEGNAPVLEGDNLTLSFVSEGSSLETKTVLNDDNIISWNESGEYLALIEIPSNGNSSLHKSDEAEVSGKKASFKVSGLSAPASYYGVYPHAAVADGSNAESVQFNAFGVQQPSMTSFDSTSDRLISMGVSSSEQNGNAFSLRFKRISALVKMNINNLPTTDPVTKVTFTAPGKNLDGTATFNLKTGKAVSYGNGDNIRIEYNNATGFNTPEGQNVIFMCWPAAFAVGDAFSVKVETSKAVYAKDMTAKAFENGKILNFAEGRSSMFKVNMGDAAAAVERPSLTNLENLAADKDGSIILSAGWDAKFNDKITSVHYKIWDPEGGYQVNGWLKEGWMTTSDDGTSATAEEISGLTPGKEYDIEAWPYIGDIDGVRYQKNIAAGATPVPVISSVANTGGDETEGVINLSVYWDSRFNKKIDKVYYELKDGAGNIVSGAKNMEYIFEDHAEQWISNLTPGGEYWVGVKPYIGETTPDNIQWFTDTPLYAGKTPVPVISSIENTAGPEEDGVINLVARWDSKFNGKINKVTYELTYGGDWVTKLSGEMTVHYDYAEVRFEALNPGEEYWPIVQPYIGETEGERADFRKAITAGMEPITTAKIASLINMAPNVSGVIQLSAGWERKYNGKITSIEYKIWNPDNYYLAGWPITGTMYPSADGTWACTDYLTGFTPGKEYDIEAWPYIDGDKGERFQQNIKAGSTSGSSGDSYTKRLFPMHHMNITQGRNGSYSHTNLNAYDLAGSDGGIDYFVATATYTVVRVLEKAATGYNNTILFYDDENDVTLAMVHMDSIDTGKWYVGKVFNPGDMMYMEGTKGNATGNHIHLEIGKGRQTSKPEIVVNGTPNYQLKNLINIEDYFYIDSSITVIDNGGYNFERR